MTRTENSARGSQLRTAQQTQSSTDNASTVRRTAEQGVRSDRKVRPTTCAQLTSDNYSAEDA